MKDKRFLELINQTFIEVRGHKIALKDVVSKGEYYTVKELCDWEKTRGDVLGKKDIFEKSEKHNIPVYSSQTAYEGLSGYTDRHNREGELLTWTTDGAKAGTLFHRKDSKSFLTNVCGSMVLKPEFLNRLAYGFMFLQLKEQVWKATDRTSANSKCMGHHVENLKVLIPGDMILENDIVTSMELQNAISDLRVKQLEILNYKLRAVSSIEKLLEMIDSDLMKGKKHKTEKNNNSDQDFWAVLSKETIEVRGHQISIVEVENNSSNPLVVKFKTILGKDFFGHGKNKIAKPWVKIVKGESKYTGSYIDANLGEYPVYSSNTDPETMGVAGYINSFDYDQESVHFTSNGEHAGTIFKIPKSKFSMNGDRGMFEIVHEALDIDYLFLSIKEGFSQNNFSWGNKPSNERISDLINIKIPEDLILPNGQVISSLDIQKAISSLRMAQKNAIKNKIKALRAIKSMLELIKESVGKV